MSLSDLSALRGILGVKGWAIGKQIGRGKYGIVYSVFRQPARTRPKKRYVLKIIPSCTSRTFENEVEIQKIFAKGGIGVHIYHHFGLLGTTKKHRSYGEHNLCGIIMERMDGTLNGLERAHIALNSVKPIANFIWKFARFACEHKYMHADAHSGNIAYRKVSRVKFEFRLLDFGYSRRLKSCRKIVSDVDDLYRSFLRLIKNTQQRTQLHNEVTKIKTYLSLNY